MAPGYVYLGGSDYALRILRELLARSDSRPICLIDTGIDDARRREIAAAAAGALGPEQIHDTAVLRDPGFLAALRARRPDFALSAHFSELLGPEFLAIPRHGTANLHSAYLPYNRGHWPEVWSIVRGTPAGITLHYIGAGIDTGDIIDQAEVRVLPEDTCEDLARRLEVEGIALVVRHWEALLRGQAVAAPQRQKLPINLHRHLDQIEQIHLDRHYTGKQLIDVLRALTLPRLLKGAYFIDPETGDRIRMRVSLTREPADRPPP